MGRSTLGAATAALQAVDGVALKVMVGRWAQASGPDQTRSFEGAFAVRQIEIGLASLLSMLFGLTISAFGIALLFSRRQRARLEAEGVRFDTRGRVALAVVGWRPGLRIPSTGSRNAGAGSGVTPDALSRSVRP